MRTVMMVLTLLVVAGCGPKFKDTGEELRYLNSLSNPTPEQFRRREELPKEIKTAKLLELHDLLKESLAATKNLEERFRIGEAKLSYRELADKLDGETNPKLKALHDEAAAGLARVLKIRPD